MGKQNNTPITLSQEEYDQKLENNISQLIDKGFSDSDIRLFGEDFKKSHVVKKKDSTVSTSTTETPSTELEPTNGSLVTQEKTLRLPEEKELKAMQAQGIAAQPSEIKARKTPKEEVSRIDIPKKRSFSSEVYHKLLKGSSQLGADIAAIPELTYDIFAMPQNAISDYFDIPSLQADSEKFKEANNISNFVKDYYKGEVSKLKQESELVDEKYKQGVYDSFKNGDYKSGFSQLTGSFAESLPATASIMLGGAYVKAPQLLAASSMTFGAGKSEQLKDEDTDLSNNERVANALGTGLAEGAFETIGSGSIGAAARGLIEREGVKKATTILKDGLTTYYKEALKRMPVTASATGEAIEEWATQVTQNSIDVATGAKPQDYNVFTGGADAFIGGAFGGSIFGGGLKGVQQIANYQDKNELKSNTQKVFKLQEQLENEETPDEIKKEIHKNINDLVKRNQSLVNKNVSHVDNLDPLIREKLQESTTVLSETEEKAKQIKADSNLSDEAKSILLDNLKQDYKEAQDLKNNILDGKTTTLDVLPTKKQDKLKKQALKELTEEKNPEGKKTIEIKSEEINDRANKIYLKQIKDAETEITVAETKPQTEVQEPTNETKEAKQDVLDEKVSESDIVADGDIRSTTGELAETGDKQQKTTETTAKQDVQPTTISEPDKGDVEVTEIKYKGSPYKTKTNNEGEITIFKKDGSEVPKYTTRKVKNKKTGKLENKKWLNSNWTKLQAIATGSKTSNETKIEREEMFKEAVDKSTPSTPVEIVSIALANGAKLSRVSVENETGEKAKNMTWATGLEKETSLPSVEVLAEQLAEANPDLGYSDIDYRNAIIEILKSTKNVQQLKDEITDTFFKKDPLSSQGLSETEQIEEYRNSLTDQELDLFDSVRAEETLNENELNEYYENEFRKQIESLSEDEQREFYEQSERDAESNNQDEGDAKSDKGKQREVSDERKVEQKTIAQKFDEQLAKWDKDLDSFGKETLGIHLPLVIARGSIKAMRAGLQAGMTIEKAVKEGIDYIKNTNWYQNLEDYKKSLIDENTFKSVIDATIKANQDSDRTIENLRERIKDKKITQKQLVDDIKTFLVENSMDGLLTPNQANVLISKSNNILVANNPVKAFDEFIDYYNKVKAKSESKVDDKARRKLKYEKMNQEVLEAKAKGAKLDTVISQIETKNNRELSDKEKQMITMIYKSGDVANMSDEDAKKLTDEGFAKTEKIVADSNKTFDNFKKSFTGLKRKFIDAQATAKSFLEKNNLYKVKDRLIALKGASGLAEKIFESAKEKIYKGLNTEQRKNLDQIIQLRRIIAIDENRAKIGMPPVLHTNYVNGEISKKSLEQYKKELGDETYSDLNKRADAYFNEFRTILNKMEDNGLINEQARKELFEIDYQPRKFLQHMMDANEEISENKKSWQKSTANLSADQIMSLDEGSVEAMITNSEWLLGTYMNMRERSMAMNTLNSKMMSEFNKKLSEIEELKKKPNLDKKEQAKVDEFEKLQKVFIDNPIIGVTKSGNAKYKFDKAPNGYRTAYYYKNGVQQKFFIKEDIYEEWYNEKKWFGNPELIENISIYSGSKLLKNMATGRNPFFLITNTPRDFIATVALSPEYSVIKPLAVVQLSRDLAKSAKSIANKDDLFNKYFQYGGSMAFLSMQGELTGKSTLKSFLEGKSDNKIVKTLLDSKVKETSGKIFDWATLHEINTYSEMVFRLSIFDRAINNRLKELGVDDISKLSKEQQEDIYFSAVASARSIMDFNQGGYITKDLESFMPYLNAATQGTRVLASGFIKRPLETTAGMLQLTTMGTLGFIAVSSLFIGLNKDDDDERTPAEIYLDNLETVSPYDRRNFFIVFTGKYDDEGNAQYIKIAKAQQITPFTEAAEHFTVNLLKREFGKKEDNDLLDKMMTITNDNISPIEFKKFKDDPSLVGTSLISRNPYGRAVMTYATGYDFYRQEKLSWDIDKKGVPKYMEGYNSDRVDDFYKEIGQDLESSPIRMKAAVESIVTSPSTNPYLGILYGGLDATLAEGSFKKRGEKMLDNTMKNINKRVVNYGKDYNTTIKEKEALQEQIERIQADNIKFNKKIDDLGEAFINKTEDKKTLTDKLIKEAKLEPYKAERAIKKIIDKQKYKDVDQFFIDLKWEESNEVKALMLYDKFGDFAKLPVEKQKKYAEQLYAIDFNFNDEIAHEYKKLKEKYN